MVVGPDAVSNMSQTRWAETTTEQLEHFLGTKFPFRRQQVIEIRVVSGREAAMAPKLDTRYEGGLFQRVITISAEPPSDPETMDELLCRALVMGNIEDRRRGARSSPPSIPEWFSMGVAQNLKLASRVRNRDVLTAWRTGTPVPAVADVIRWQALPEGWPRYRSVCGMFLNWLGTFGRDAAPYDRILNLLAGNGMVTSEWLAGDLTGIGSASDMEAAWREWVGRQSNVIQSFGELSSVLIERLASELPLIVPSDKVGDLPMRLSPREAIGKRDLQAVSVAAMEKAQSLRALTLGKAKELVEVGGLYACFYESLSKGSMVMVLKYRLGKAEKALEKLADLTRKREAYMDVVEREQRRRTPEWRETSSPREPVLDKGRIERYLDGAEQKFRHVP